MLITVHHVPRKQCGHFIAGVQLAQSPYTCWEQWVLCSVAHARKWPSQDLFELVVTHCSTVPVDDAAQQLR